MSDASTKPNTEPTDNREHGYAARLEDQPLSAFSSVDFKAGWMEADYEIQVDDGAS